MGWTTPRTWVASEIVTAAVMNAHVRDNFNAINTAVAKTADETVSASTVIQDDDHLLISIGAAGTYHAEVQLWAFSSINAGGDIQCGFSFPTGTLDFAGYGPHNQLASGSNENGEWSGSGYNATSGTTVIPYGLSTTPGVAILLRARLVATATGTLRLRWAQLSASGTSTVRSRSYMELKQVA